MVRRAIANSTAAEPRCAGRYPCHAMATFNHRSPFLRFMCLPTQGMIITKCHLPDTIHLRQRSVSPSGLLPARSRNELLTYSESPHCYMRPTHGLSGRWLVELAQVHASVHSRLSDGSRRSGRTAALDGVPKIRGEQLCMTGSISISFYMQRGVVILPQRLHCMLSLSEV